MTTKMELIQKHLDEIRRIIESTPRGYARGVVLVKLNEAEMWAATDLDLRETVNYFDEIFKGTFPA